ncbi:unnamed protein product [Cylicocyclus nassatus]|uniref:Uncharacterized protein n=1 Tax=Cylicocyclus nassatus TaxID=53992 RepID=A0AA36GLP5_CYLNA|nr:unnamed protein product [Cylicocyclus nassatus]
MGLPKTASSMLVRVAQPYGKFTKVSQRTTVLLLGWAMARDYHLTKYAQIYEKMGLTTLRFTSAFTGHTRNLKYSRDISGLMDNLRSVLASPKDRLALHVFSMNGIYTLCSLLLQYPELDILGRTDGIIFDSCPVLFDASSPRSFATLANVLARTVQNASLWEKLKFAVWRAYFTMGIRFFLLEQGVRRQLGLSLTEFTPYHFLRDHPQLPHHLSFIYSDKDRICPPESLTQFHEAVAEKGKQVDVLHLKDSNHVEHLKKYPDEYCAVIERFLAQLERTKSRI